MSGWLGGGGPHLSCSVPHSAGHSSNSSQGTMLSQWCVMKPHKVPHLVCLGGGVWGRSVEWGLLALVPVLGGDTHHREEGDTHHREEGREKEGWEGQRERGERREGKEK